MLENFQDLYNKLKDAQDAINEGTNIGLKTAGARIKGAAKAKLGTYQPAVGPYPAWSKLKAKTVRSKNLKKSEENKVENALYVIGKGKYKGDIRFRRHLAQSGNKYLKKHGEWGGGGNDDAPLIDTGHLKQSITTDTKDVDDGIVYVGVIKASCPGAAAHEFGYAPKKIPARPYLRPAVFENKEAARDDIAKAVREEIEKIWQS